MLESGTAKLPTAVVHEKRVIRLGSVVRPQVDLELLAQAVVLLAEDIAKDADRADAFVRQRGGGPE